VPTAAQKSTIDANLLIDSKHLRRIDDLFIELGKLFKAHARATERKRRKDEEK
jgi:hypothetical protein